MSMSWFTEVLQRWWIRVSFFVTQGIGRSQKMKLNHFIKITNSLLNILNNIYWLTASVQKKSGILTEFGNKRHVITIWFVINWKLSVIVWIFTHTHTYTYSTISGCKTHNPHWLFVQFIWHGVPSCCSNTFNATILACALYLASPFKRDPLNSVKNCERGSFPASTIFYSRT